MLYLLRSYTKDGSMLKVGFAESYKNRLRQYQTSNPGIEEVSKKDGKFVDETILHLYLHSLGYGIYKNEWYVDSQIVIDIFNMPAEDINRLAWDNRDKVFSQKGSLELSHKNAAVYYAYSELLSLFGWGGYFCSADELFLGKIDEVLDEQRIRAGELSEIAKEIRQSTIDEISEDVKSRIYSEFEVGKRYAKYKIKEQLSVIYLESNYNKTAQATDLEKYFEIHDCSVHDEGGTGKYKYKPGFEIIKKK